MTKLRNDEVVVDDFDFPQIAPRCGGKSEAFEELCCQLAYRSLPAKTVYTRLRGAGGDGGVECYADLPDGRIGWQAKYVYNIDSLLAQATKSLTTALSLLTCRHFEVNRYFCTRNRHPGPYLGLPALSLARKCVMSSRLNLRSPRRLIR